MLWAYLSFSQFLIIWSANIPEEIPHYLDRWDNSWKYLSIFIVVGHFIVPYALLLSRDLKRNMGKLRVIATWILVARVADYYWHMAPELHKGGFDFSLLDIALPLALGGIFITLFVSQPGRPLVAAGQRSGLGQGAASPCPLSDAGAGSEHDHEYGPTPAGAKHEHTDIDPSVGYKFALWLGVAMLISVGLVYGAFRLFEGQESAASRRAAAVSAAPAGQHWSRRRQTCSAAVQGHLPAAAGRKRKADQLRLGRQGGRRRRASRSIARWK